MVWLVTPQLGAVLGVSSGLESESGRQVASGSLSGSCRYAASWLSSSSFYSLSCPPGKVHYAFARCCLVSFRVVSCRVVSSGPVFGISFFCLGCRVCVIIVLGWKSGRARTSDD